MDRRFFRLEGKSQVPNPFERGLLHEPEGTSNVRWEDSGYVYRHPSKRTVDGRDELWIDPRDERKSQQIGPRSQSREARRGRPLHVRTINGNGHGTLDFPIATSMESVARAIIKIAYETAALLLGDRYLDSESAKSARDFLRDPEATIASVRGRFVDAGQGLSGLAAAGVSILIAGVVPIGREALAYVGIFNRCELALFIGEGVGESIPPDGIACRIDVAERTKPVRTTFRVLGWFDKASGPGGRVTETVRGAPSGPSGP